MDLSIKGTNFLGYLPSQKGTQTFSTFSCRYQKSNEEVFHQITESELEIALEKASAASEKYALAPIEKRRNFLREIIALLEEHRTLLVQQFSKESSLSEDRGNVELARTQAQIQTYLDFISRKDWNLLHSQELNGVSFEKRLCPIGPVVVFGASNFPFAYSTVGGDVASALASGNPVIYKANPFHAGLSEMVAGIVLQAAENNDLPDGVFSLVQGNDYWIGETLLKDERVKAVGFTGSVRGGEALLNYAKERKTPIPVFCEMGSLNPVFIFKDAFEGRTKEMVEKLSSAIKNDGGQFCTKPGLLFIEERGSEMFINAMRDEFTSAAAVPLLHPSIYNSFLKLSSVFDRFPVYRVEATAPEYSVYPQLTEMTAKEFSAFPAAKEEVFGPFSTIVKCADESEMKACFETIGGHLAASVWTDQSLSEEWMYLLSSRVGRIIKNGVSTGVAVIDSMHHGGNFPSTSDSRFTAVGKDAIYRFLQPVTLQNFKS